MSSGARSNRSGTRLSSVIRVTGTGNPHARRRRRRGIEDRVEQLLLGLEVVQQPCGRDPASLAICASDVLRQPLRASSRSATARMRCLRSSPLARNVA